MFSLEHVRHTGALRSRLESLLITVAIVLVMVGALGQAAARLGVVEAVPLSAILQVSGLLVLAASVMWAGWRARKARNLRDRRGLVREPQKLSTAHTLRRASSR